MGHFIVCKTTWNKFIAAIRARRRFRMVFYTFCYYFRGQHCYWTETSIIDNDFAFHKFPLRSTLLLHPLPYHCPGVPANNLWQRHKHSCGYFKSIQTQLSAICNDNDTGLYVISAKPVTNGRKYTLLENSYTLPPEYDFWKDANGARAFMGKFSWYRKGKTFN